jgi:hypothetical protein
MMEGVVRRGSVIVERSLGGAWGGILRVMSRMSPECEGSLMSGRTATRGVNKQTKLELPQQAGSTLHAYLVCEIIRGN